MYAYYDLLIFRLWRELVEIETDDLLIYQKIANLLARNG